MMADQSLKLYAIADFDLVWCQKYLIAYIELMTPQARGEHDAWIGLQSREFPGEHNFLDILGRSLAQSIIISYSRPWSTNRGDDGRPARLEESLLLDIEKLLKREAPGERLLPFDRALHLRVVRMRDKIVAHSDHAEWEFGVDRSGSGTRTDLADPFRYFSLEEARTLLANTESLRSELAACRRHALLAPEGDL